MLDKPLLEYMSKKLMSTSGTHMEFFFYTLDI